MLTMVMAKPMLLTMVSAEPFDCGGACFATNDENNGESAITNNPHNHRKISNAIVEGCCNSSGETKQQQQESNNALRAMLAVPND